MTDRRPVFIYINKTGVSKDVPACDLLSAHNSHFFQIYHSKLFHEIEILSRNFLKENVLDFDNSQNSYK